MIDVETIFDSDREEYEFMQENKEQPMKEQIEEMARVIDELLVEKTKETTKHTMNVATYLFDRGYCKQKEGEWKPIIQELGYCDTLKCTICGEIIDVSEGNYKYCPNCGAKMKGADNG